MSTPVAVQCHYVRDRNVLLASADCGPLFMEHYLHLGKRGVTLAGADDTALKEALAAVMLHAACRPRAESAAWTLHDEEEARNIFVTAENPGGRVTGQVFREGVKTMGRSLLYAEAAAPGQPRRQSVVEPPPGGVTAAVEAFYRQSEQRSGRFFDAGEDLYLLAVAQPDADEEWLAGLQAAEAAALPGEPQVRLLETRVFRHDCGCTHEQMLGVLEPVMRRDPAGLFEDSETITISCPRCGTRHTITREQLEARTNGPGKEPAG